MEQLSFLCLTCPQQLSLWKKTYFIKRRLGQIISGSRRRTDILWQVRLSATFRKSFVFASFIGRKAIGVDYGVNRVGIAVSVGFSPRPLPFIKHENDTALVLNKLSEIVSSELAEIIVIGLPLSARVEHSSSQTRKAMDFAQLVANRFPNQDVYLCDEKYTSIVANERLAERGISALNAKDLVDSEAAVVLLERFFGGWSFDDTGVYLKQVRSQLDMTGGEQVDTLRKQGKDESTYKHYREWRQNLLRKQS